MQVLIDALSAQTLLKLADDNQRKALTELLGKDGMTDDEVDQVRAIFKESGAFDATQELMSKLLAEGQEALKTAEPPLQPEYLEFLVELSEFLTSRAF